MWCIMKTEPTPAKSPRRETGIRLHEDQIRKLDLLVSLTKGRRKRSHFICEAIDEFLATKLNSLSIA